MRCARALAAALGLIACPAAADEDPICADRPGQGTSTCTVPAATWQVETGLAGWSLHKGGGARESGVTLGETAIRYGLTGHSEIAVALAPWQRLTSKVAGLRERASGFGDVHLLYKHRLTAINAAVQLAIMPVVKIPTARRPLGNRRWEGALLLPIDHDIGRSALSINLTPELDWVADADGRGHHVAMAQVAGLGWQASRRLNLSAEIAGAWDWDPSGRVRQASANGAAAYLLSSDVQLDAGANFGLNRNTPDVQLYAGVAKRF